MFTFIELKPFADIRDKYMDDEEFAEFQLYLMLNPEIGDVIPHSGGCRKVRWSLRMRGKRGGIRVIYFLRLKSGEIILVTMYSKNVRENIDPKLLKKIREAFKDG